MYQAFNISTFLSFPKFPTTFWPVPCQLHCHPLSFGSSQLCFLIRKQNKLIQSNHNFISEKKKMYLVGKEWCVVALYPQLWQLIKIQCLSSFMSQLLRQLYALQQFTWKDIDLHWVGYNSPKAEDSWKEGLWSATHYVFIRQSNPESDCTGLSVEHPFIKYLQGSRPSSRCCRWI